MTCKLASRPESRPGITGGYGCRIADEAPTADRWAFALLAGGLLAGVITWVRPNVGLRLTGAVAIVCALTVFFVPMGH